MLGGANLEETLRQLDSNGAGLGAQEREVLSAVQGETDFQYF